MFMLTAPAKLNLTLEITGKRCDGYHEIATVMQAVTLCDWLAFRENQSLQFFCDLPGWQATESLVTRAASLLEPGKGERGAAIYMAKRIPLAAGLGGDSSDAAAVLRGLNLLWELGLSDDRLRELAAEMGSDVPFFINGGTALAEGRGERIERLPDASEGWFILLHPLLRIPERKTAALYRNLSAADYTDGSATRSLAACLREGHAIDAAEMPNAFERVAGNTYEGLEKVRQDFLNCGAARVQLAGSGPCLFAFFEEEGLAIEVQAALKSSGYSSWLVRTRPAHEDSAWK